MRGTLRQLKQSSNVSELLYGDGAWEISKELTDKQKRQQARIGLATNIVGIAAGTAGLGAALRNPALRKAGATAENAGPVTGKLLKKFRRLSPRAQTALVAAGAGGAAGLQAANLGGDAVANRVLSREANKKVKKNFTPIAKAEGFDVRGEVSKMDAEKKQIFGWASIVEVNGEPVIDLQGDYMTMETVEKAAYDYVKSSRKGGNQHQRTAEGPKHVSDMIESLIVTEDKKKALGLPPDTPTGWWVGFQVNDDDTWQEYKTGKKTQFSIHGSGIRKDVEI